MCEYARRIPFRSVFHRPPQSYFSANWFLFFIYIHTPRVVVCHREERLARTSYKKIKNNRCFWTADTSRLLFWRSHLLYFNDTSGACPAGSMYVIFLITACTAVFRAASQSRHLFFSPFPTFSFLSPSRCLEIRQSLRFLFFFLLSESEYRARYLCILTRMVLLEMIAILSRVRSSSAEQLLKIK